MTPTSQMRNTYALRGSQEPCLPTGPTHGAGHGRTPTIPSFRQARPTSVATYSRLMSTVPSQTDSAPCHAVVVTTTSTSQASPKALGPLRVTGAASHQMVAPDASDPNYTVNSEGPDSYRSGVRLAHKRHRVPPGSSGENALPLVQAEV